MRYTESILRDVAQMGANEALKAVGLTSGEITQNQARTTYGRWFRKAVESGKLKPCRRGEGRTGTMWFSVSDILALRASEQIQAELL